MPPPRGIGRSSTGPRLPSAQEVQQRRDARDSLPGGGRAHCRGKFERACINDVSQSHRGKPEVE